MTTIQEMDEFFNFEDAAQSCPLDFPNDIDFDSIEFPAGPYNPSLAFAGEENDENSFTCLQHYSSPDWGTSTLASNAKNDSTMDTTMMGAADFMDFPRWINGMDVPNKPCAYCQRMRIHCKVIQEGTRKGSCTSCVALARSCSLTRNLFLPDNDKYRCITEDFCLPGNTIYDTASVGGLSTPPVDQPLQPCDYCEGRGYSCKQIPEAGRTGACTSCVALDRHCSLVPQQDLGEWVIPDGRKPNNTWIPGKSPVEEGSPNACSRSLSTPNLVSLKSSDENLDAAAPESGPKIGARFSRESVRLLRGWLSTHHRHPYPTEEQKECLQRQTGLNKTQITNWLANARRRGKVRAPRSTSPSPNQHINAMDIPRRSTPALENMNPLERWKNSPPENEPASITAITKAVTSSTFSSEHDSPYASYGHTDDSSHSICRDSTNSSLGTSQSSANSFASAFSHKSKGSFGSFNSFGNRGRRRRRRAAPKPVKVPNANGPARTFQCTFCTETFKTKHDWQRHEKSLHLSLERWVCCPDGPTQFCANDDHNRCVFCGLPNPPNGHAEIHNYSSCADRCLEERTFYRKDHLRQHLNLVHDVKFQSFSMEKWKVATPEIRSRCGFCGMVMGSWGFRVDHLAEHFKGGKSMADWKGDWGFESQVLDIVENGMPPYLIHDERNSPEPYSGKAQPSDHRTLEDLVKIGLQEYVHERVLDGAAPTDADLLKEARKIVRKADEFISKPGCLQISWFRDLILKAGHNSSQGTPNQESTEDLTWEKKLDSIRTSAPHNDIDMAAIVCNKERQLKAFVLERSALGLTALDSELQVAACRILDEIEISSNFRCKPAVDWFKFLVASSTEWLSDFRRRANLPRSDEMADQSIRPTDEASIDYTIHNQQRLEAELIDWVKLQRAQDITPTDHDIQSYARMSVYKNNDPWNQTIMDNPALLFLFKRQQGLAPDNEDGPDMPPIHAIVGQSPKDTNLSSKDCHWNLQDSVIEVPSPSSTRINTHGTTTPDPFDQPLITTIQNQPSTNTNPAQPLKYFLNDANCYGRLVRELARFVTTCTSVNNPNRHIPSDAEIQNQARWVIFDDDDPWNQTAADNAEWLLRFKRDVGLAPQTDGPGLPHASTSWQVGLGGSGFMPPYLNPAGDLSSHLGEDVPVRMEDKVYNIKASTAQKFAKSIKTRFPPPGTVFCSRELERGLNDFVFEHAAMGSPVSDEAIRGRARELMGVEETAADDIHLLEKFKAMHGLLNSQTTTTSSLLPIDAFSSEADFLAEFDHELAMGSMDLDTTPPSAENIAGGEIMNGAMQRETTIQATGIGREYADLYRVNAATSSPLRREASVGMAKRRGVGEVARFPSSGRLL
ncbi:hypothetical protein BJ875DRAFT_455420 [Amylocarpus encephaloides]|uniref:Uncharacterized protein n=1 Tax=Amylocarpus encephaloides TaxID=45428 RepID=A0A9P7YMX2_9HELO|nr:hypothetical protein BJ875DRAFT_455420 [Amylocarpus encephaloides]